MKKYLYENLNISLDKKEIISFVGAGGKTTTIFTLAEELKSLGKKVLITTTTKIFVPDKESYDNFFLSSIEKDKIKPGTISIYAEKIDKGKINEVAREDLEAIIGKDYFDYYLIEADGAKHKPIKAPKDYEPIITNSTTKTIGLIGLDALYKNIVEISHRSELLLKLLGRKSTDSIEKKDLINLTLDKKGLFKDSIGEKILLLNKANNSFLVEEAKSIREELYKYNFKNVIITDILNKSFY